LWAGQPAQADVFALQRVSAAWTPQPLCLQSRILRNIYFGTSSTFSYVMFEHSVNNETMCLWKRFYAITAKTARKKFDNLIF